MFDFERKIVKGRRIPHLFHPNVSIGQILLDFLEKSPEKIAQVNHDDGSTLTCEELRQLSIRVCLNLTEKGVKPGDVVGLIAKSSTYVAPIMIGCFLLRCPVVTLDPAFIVSEIDHVLKYVKPKLIFSDYNVVDNMRNFLKAFHSDAEVVSLLQDRDDCLKLEGYLAEHKDEQDFMYEIIFPKFSCSS